MIALRLAATLAFALFVAAPVQAQTIHRTNVPAGDATPTGASFSIRFPIPFNDVEMRADDPDNPPVIVRMLTGKTTEGIRLSATETPFLPGQPPKPMGAFMEATKRRPGAVVSDAQHEQKDGMDILSFALNDASGGTYFRMVRANDAQYMQVIQFPESQRAEATAMKDDFFGSFKITKP